MPRPILAISSLVACTLFIGCSRQSAPKGTAAATPTVHLATPASNVGAEPERLGDDEFRPVDSKSPQVPPAAMFPFGRPLLALPVVKVLHGPQGTKKWRLVGVVGPRELGKFLDQHGQLQARIIEADGLEIVAIDDDRLTVQSGENRDVLDASQLIENSSPEVWAPRSISQHVAPPVLPSIAPPMGQSPPTLPVPVMPEFDLPSAPLAPQAAP